ncbi:hypothetical protein GE061_015883 [Apolygus lucorum]|uniref:CHK kinase-like domain-containing protein n=1 Tax=Apolygus lucorum TaxID=248454 RepID=A0A6A4IZU5_APOLU|nr:hypothetical protein GE061_015883 [Apolygus lucorum]
MEDHGLDTKLLERFLKEKYCDAKPVEVISTDVKRAVPVGDNYGSIVYRVKFNTLTASGRTKQRSLIVKTVAEWMKVLQGANITASPAFRAEITNYSTVLSFMEDLMEEFEDKRCKLWPEMIGNVPYNMIAFEDLTEDLYNGAKRTNGMDFKESMLVMRSLGRFHAMSKVLIDRGFISQQDKGQIALASEGEFFEKLWLVYFTLLSGAMEEWGQEWGNMAKKLSQLGSKANKRWAELGGTYDKKFEVLNHGDLWLCNLLFKRMEFEEIPVFVDFQCTHLNSFIWDVEYFLHTSTIPSVRRANKDLFHSAYQESLEKNLNFFNYSGYIPTLDDVKAESQRIQFVGMCCTVLQPLLASGKTLAIEKIMTHSPEHIVDKSVYADGKAQELIGEDLKNFYDNGVMDVTSC